MRELLNRFRTSWRTYLLWGLFWAVLLVPLTATYIYIEIHEGDNSRPHVPELRELADQIPLYPGAKKTGERVMLKNNLALLTVSYRSDGSFADVKSFYQTELPARGWTPPKGPSNRLLDFDAHSGDFRRGNYFIALEPDAHSNSFSIAFMWEPQ